MRRRRDKDQDANQHARDAGGRRAAYQADSVARAPRPDEPAYEQYEIYEEYEDLPPSSAAGQPRSTVVMPAVTLPSIPATPTPQDYAPSRHSSAGWRRTSGPDLNFEPDEDRWLNDTPVAPTRGRARKAQRDRGSPASAAAADPRNSGWGKPPDAGEVYSGTAVRASLAPRPQNPHRRLTQAERIAPRVVPMRPVAPVATAADRAGADIVFIPAARTEAPKPIRNGSRRIVALMGAIARRPALVSGVVLVVMLLGIIASVTGAAQEAGIFTVGAWRALAGAGPATNLVLNGPIIAPANFDAKHYIQKYGFFQPGPPAAISADESARLVQMLPAAIRAAAAYDKRYNKSIEPQMLLYWTHAEGIRARINYSNCANEDPRPGTTWNSDIENCDHANFWQLGYGNQFGEIYVLRNAFIDLFGDPNDTQLVAKVGQWVLDFDKQMGTTPPCGGYSCTFPAKTIDQILSGVNLRTGVVAEGNWWASVLSRDPAINSYMIAHALTYFNHEATRNWVGCYYAAPCWQRNSDRLGDILAAWPDLIKAAGIQG
jgi:hypothetical protein